MGKLHAKVIVNPVAGANSTYRKWPHISRLLREAGLSFDYHYTEGVGHAIELARGATQSGYPFVVAVGGDGTVSEVANGILTAVSPASAALGIVNTGTGNDFVRSLGKPMDYSLSCRSLTGSGRLVIDVGEVEYWKGNQPLRRFFVNGAGVGFDAEVTENVHKLPKLGGGTIPYVMGLVRTLLGYHNKPVTMGIDGKQDERRILSVVVANGAYFGGGMHIAPGAELGDRSLDVLTIGDMGKFELLRAFPRVYKGTHITHPKVRLERAGVVRIESEQRLLLQADGELIGEGPVTFRVVPAALQIVV